jgi:5-methylthioadenosine/S-adenosylhomocysteine deaminase
VEQLTNFSRFHADSECRAFFDCGMRASVARGISTQSTIDSMENADPDEEYSVARKFIQDWQGKGLVQPWLGPAGLYSTDEATLMRIKDLCREAGVGFHIHLSETHQQAEFARQRGYSGQIDWAYRLGLLDDKTSIAHAVWMNPAEFEMLKATRAKVIHNPSSNQILASGVANVPMWIETGLDIALGTDGPASNDSMDMIGEMKSCVLLHRVNTLNPNVVSATDAFKMATNGGAGVFGLADRLGKIEPGYLADITCVRVDDNPSLNPVYNPIEALVYYGSGRDVVTTIVNGNIVFQGGRYDSLDIESCIRHVQRIAEKVKSKLLPQIAEE